MDDFGGSLRVLSLGISLVIAALAIAAQLRARLNRSNAGITRWVVGLALGASVLQLLAFLAEKEAAQVRDANVQAAISSARAAAEKRVASVEHWERSLSMSPSQQSAVTRALAGTTGMVRFHEVFREDTSGLFDGSTNPVLPYQSQICPQLQQAFRKAGWSTTYTSETMAQYGDYATPCQKRLTAICRKECDAVNAAVEAIRMSGLPINAAEPEFRASSAASPSAREIVIVVCADEWSPPPHRGYSPLKR